MILFVTVVAEKDHSDVVACDNPPGVLVQQPAPELSTRRVPPLFSTRHAFVVLDSTLQENIPGASQPFSIRLTTSQQMSDLMELQRRLAGSSFDAQIADTDMELLVLLLDVIDEIPSHVIGLCASVIRQRRAMERISQLDTLSHSLLPRITSICIDRSTNSDIVLTCLAFTINLTATSFTHRRWQQFATSSFSHMIGVCLPLVNSGSPMESLFAVELLGNYCLLSPHLSSVQRLHLLHQVMHAIDDRLTSDALVVKLLVALGTLLELVPGRMEEMNQSFSHIDAILTAVQTRMPHLAPIIFRLKQLLDD
uniref:PUL domain-containing protein n=1 Tax=Spongospora subterranea TaxID=70186 RepID=A0A0H5R9V9_9EUKA|eukprot:CRZ10878.1 hypothetical protein [Spongospora subterranea]